MKRLFLKSILILFALFIILSMFFTVDETEYAIVSQFGNPVRIIDQPGLKWKFPVPVNAVMRFDKRIAVFNSKPSEFLTQDKKNILVESFACWKIADAKKFLQTVKNRAGARIRLGDMISSEVGAALGRVKLHSLISTDPEAVVLPKIMKEVSSNCAKKAKQNYGIEVLTVRLKRLNFPEQNKIAVYNRMRSERKRIAKKYRAEGREKAENIRAETDKEVTRILSEAYHKAEEIKGEGDAQSARIYADAYKKDPAFYKMIRTLESYSKFLDKQTTIVLSSDAELLKLLGNGGGK